MKYYARSAAILYGAATCKAASSIPSERNHFPGNLTPAVESLTNIRIGGNLRSEEAFQKSKDIYRRKLVINGNSVDDSNFPFLASLDTLKKDSIDGRAVKCGGTLIAPRVVLTAANCIVDNNIDQVTIGCSDDDINHCFPEETFEIEEIAIHPNYRGSIAKGHDAMLILLDDESGRDTVILDNCDRSWNRHVVNIIGWYTEGHGRIFSYSDGLEVFSHLRAVACNDEFDDSIILCTENTDSSPRGYCGTDSGGPGLVKGDGDWNVQVGIISNGDGSNSCVTDKPQLYTSVSSIIPWIEEILDEWDEEMTTLCKTKKEKKSRKKKKKSRKKKSRSRKTRSRKPGSRKLSE